MPFHSYPIRIWSNELNFQVLKCCLSAIEPVGVSSASIFSDVSSIQKPSIYVCGCGIHQKICGYIIRFLLSVRCFALAVLRSVYLMSLV